jgi:hypothetical protein
MMKFIFCFSFGILLLGNDVFSATPTLSASAIQPTYPGTSKPYFTIVAGSGKTSYVGGVINDPTDPAAVYGIYFTVSVTDATFTITSSNTTVVPVVNAVMTFDGIYYILKIVPTGIGYSDIKIIAKNSGGSSSTYTIHYAASLASYYPKNTIYPTNINDASGVNVVDGNYMFIADDETNVIRMFNRKMSGGDVYNIDVNTFLKITSGNECDFEGGATSVKYNPGKRYYWMGSGSNNKNGNIRAERNTVLATDINGTGSGTTLTPRSYSNLFRDSLIKWGDNLSWNFTASAASSLIPKSIDGYNIESLAIAGGGDTGYVGFRAPLVPLKGISPTSSNRLYAVMAPVTNFETILNGTGKVTVGPKVSTPILFDFNGFGFRDMFRVNNNLYLIIAGYFDGGGQPAVYLWDGRVPTNSGSNPITTTSTNSTLIKLTLPGLDKIPYVATDASLNGHPEAITAELYGNLLYIHLISDDGSVDYYNDGNGFQAKDLTNLPFKKFRNDNFIYDLSSYLTGCPSSQMFFIATNHIPGNTYQWQQYNGSAYTNINNAGIYTGISSDTLFLNNPSTTLYGNTYRCAITNNSVVTYSNDKILKFTAYWIGNVSNAWENPGNWSCNFLPDSNTDVIINHGTPVLSSSTAIRSLMINPTANLTIITGNKLTIVH